MALSCSARAVSGRSSSSSGISGGGGGGGGGVRLAGGRRRRAPLRAPRALPGKPLREPGSDDEGLEAPEGLVEAEFKEAAQGGGEGKGVDGGAQPARVPPPAKKDDSLVGKATAVLDEIKMIQWPSAGQVASSTGVVFGVLIFTSVVMLGVNYLLSSAANNLFEKEREGGIGQSPAEAARRISEEEQRLGLAAEGAEAEAGSAMEAAAAQEAPPLVVAEENAFPSSL